MRYIGSSGGGYGWGHIYYDSETGKCYEESYHCGCVDLSEDHYDGIAEKDKKYVVETLMEKNDLLTLIEFYKELDVGKLLPCVLADLQKSHDGPFSEHNIICCFQEIARYCKYFSYFYFQNGDYAICADYPSGRSKCEYYSPTYDGKYKVDFPVVDRIIKEKDTVLFSKYIIEKNRWECYSESGKQWSNVEVKNPLAFWENWSNVEVENPLAFWKDLERLVNRKGQTR